MSGPGRPVAADGDVGAARLRSGRQVKLDFIAENRLFTHTKIRTEQMH